MVVPVLWGLHTLHTQHSQTLRGRKSVTRQRQVDSLEEVKNWNIVREWGPFVRGWWEDHVKQF